MCQKGANRNPWAGYRMGSSRPSLLPNTPNWGLKSPPFQFQPAGWRLMKMSATHIWEYIGWLWNDAMGNRTAFARAPNEWKQIEHSMCGRRAARSPLWWWPCKSTKRFVTQCIKFSVIIVQRSISWEKKYQKKLLSSWKCSDVEPQSSTNCWAVPNSTKFHEFLGLALNSGVCSKLRPRLLCAWYCAATQSGDVVTDYFDALKAGKRLLCVVQWIGFGHNQGRSRFFLLCQPNTRLLVNKLTWFILDVTVNPKLLCIVKHCA